jgi:hypothetical protein
LRSFADLDALIGLVPAQVVTRLSAIDFGRGSEALYRDQMPGLLTELADRARRSWIPPTAGTVAPPTHGPGSATSPA